MSHTAGPWHAFPRISPSRDDPGYRLVAVIERGTPRICIYAEAARMLQEGKGFVWGTAEDDGRLLSAAPELAACLAESLGMLSACADILAGRARQSSAAAEEILQQHAKGLALLKRCVGTKRTVDNSSDSVTEASCQMNKHTASLPPG